LKRRDSEKMHGEKIEATEQIKAADVLDIEFLEKMTINGAREKK